MGFLKVSCVFALLLCSFHGQGQISFYRVFGGNGYDRAEGLAQLPDSSYIVTGSSSSFEDAPSQAFLLKLDKLGFHVWSKEYGGAEFEEGKRVIFVPNYGYYIIGTSSSNAGGGFDGYVVFTDLNGNQQWEKWYDNGGWERFHDALLLPDTSIVMFGETDVNPEQTPDQYMVRIDKAGTVIWSQQQGGIGLDLLKKGARITDTTFVAVGTRYLADSLKSKAFIGVFHKDGSLIWDTLTGNDGEYLLHDVQIVGTKIATIGEKTKTGKTDQDNYHIILDLDGNFLSTEEFYAPNNNRYVAFVNYAAPPGDRFFLANQLMDSDSYPDGEDCLINRFNFGLYWDGYGTGYSGVGQDQVNHMIRTNDGFGAAVGFHTDPGFSTGGSSLFMVKIGSETNFPSNATPDVYSILDVETLENNPDLSVYPNPFSESIQIASSGSFEFIEIMDLSGKQVYVSNTLVSSIETGSWQNGTYLIRCLVNGNWYTRKLVKF